MPLKQTALASYKSAPKIGRWLAFGSRSVAIKSGKVELGQGVHTALRQIAADALALPLDSVNSISPATSTSPDEGVTSGSLSVEDSGQLIRCACLTLKSLVIEEIAERHGLAADALRFDGGFITDSNAVVLGSLFDLAPQFLSDDLDLGHVGGRMLSASASAPRSDLPDKVMGRPRLIHDLNVPDMLHGRILRGAHYRAVLMGSSEIAQLCRPNVRLLSTGSVYGVVGSSEAEVVASWRAIHTKAKWGGSINAPEDPYEWLRSEGAETTILADRSTQEELPNAIFMEASYRKPFIAHASIGTCCSIAAWQNGNLHVWSQSQGIFNLRRDLALTFGVSEDQVTVEHHEGAGCYGHNPADDVALDAALLSRLAGSPVRVIWMREDELRCAPYGPAMAIDLNAVLDRSGRIRSWNSNIISPGHSSRPGRSSSPALLAAWSMDKPYPEPAPINMPLAVGGGSERNAVPIYDFGICRVVSNRLPTSPLRCSSLRSLGAFANVFAIESFIDELADAAGEDPIEFRIRHLSDRRAISVLRAAADRAGWEKLRKCPPENHGVGCAVARYKGVAGYCAVIAQVNVSTTVSVEHLTIAADIGEVVNPNGAINQIEGGAIQAMSWALFEEVRYTSEGVAGLGTWEDYPILRFPDVPTVDAFVLDSTENAVGAGELAQGPTAGAIANAVFHAFGVRVRSLPLTADNIVAAMESSGG